MADHYLDLKVEQGWLTKDFRCTATDLDDVETSRCRWYCDECEEVCDHEMTSWKNHLDYCRETEGWFDDAELEEMYDGEPTAFRSGLVEFTWDGDSYFWHYAPEPNLPEPLFVIEGEAK